ncbi:MAG: type VI secretion system ATPase TssH, partial [Firmicutes bacterium]|nr:type VI secretion system ATPase TssH [Bacillota bacterium]
MNANKFTQKSLEALENAEVLAKEYQHQQLQQTHLLLALLTQEGGLIPQLLAKAGADAAALAAAAEERLSAMPKVSGDSEQLYLAGDLNAALSAAEKTARDMGDEYVSVEHLFLSLLEQADPNVKELLKAHPVNKESFLAALKAVRGHRKVTSDSPEDTYDVLAKYGQDLVELARQQKLDPVIGRDSEIRNVIRILSRKTKNNPVLIGEPGVGKTAVVEGL